MRHSTHIIMALAFIAGGCTTQGAGGEEATRAAALGARAVADEAGGARGALAAPAATPARDADAIRDQLTGMMGGYESEPTTQMLHAVLADDADLADALMAIYQDADAPALYRMRALGLMRHTGQAARGAYEAVLADPGADPMYTRVATRAYAATVGIQGRAVLRAQLVDPDPYTRAAAAQELGKLHDDEALRAHMTTEPAEHVRWTIQLALGEATMTPPNRHHAREVAR
jgi:hypothetical protein